MENVKEFAEYATTTSTRRVSTWLTWRSMPAEFLKEGTLFMNRCTSTRLLPLDSLPINALTQFTEPDKKEFIRISQAVGIGFLIMGASPLSLTSSLD